MTGVQARILIADDDPVARELLVEVLKGEGYEAIAAAGGAEAVTLARETNCQLALIDLKMPDLDGMQVLKQLKSFQPDLPVIIVTAFADMDTAVAAIRAGAHDYLSKPFRMDEIKETVQRTLKAGKHARVQKAPGLNAGSDQLVGKTAAMLAVYKLVARVANGDATVLITGETGTGKEQIAQAIHEASPRAHEPFVTLDCTALPETLSESELFGHERGAFTGAHAQRQGMLETARAGTCFLDEIGELSLALQAKLLRALQEKVIRRVGGNQTIPLRARIIAATNRDLARLVRQHEFREDLLYRLDVMRVHIPPLRERAEDIPLLVQHFLDKYGAKNSIPTIAPETMAVLCAYNWPGNVRQLENVIHRAVAVSPSATIFPDDLPPQIRGEETAGEQTENPVVNLQQLKKQHVLEVLEQAGGNKQRAARILGIDRRTLYRILDRAEKGEDETR